MPPGKGSAAGIGSQGQVRQRGQHEADDDHHEPYTLRVARYSVDDPVHRRSADAVERREERNRAELHGRKVAWDSHQGAQNQTHDHIADNRHDDGDQAIHKDLFAGELRRYGGCLSSHSISP